MSDQPPPPLAGLARVRNAVVVLSGKGGVGKSSVSVQLAVSLALAGHRVGLLDVDLCGPSIPRMLNVCDARVTQGPLGWQPVSVSDGRGHEIRVMSIAFLLPGRDDAVVWRGPKKNSMIGQFLSNVDWGVLDYLVVDTPPGTSDEHIAIAESLVPLRAHAVVVTTPQLVAIADVEREITFCRTVGMPIVGVVENMSGYVCPHCSHCTNVFSRDGGEQLALKHGLPFLGRVPICPQFARLVESDTASILQQYEEAAPELHGIFAQIASTLSG